MCAPWVLNRRGNFEGKKNVSEVTKAIRVETSRIILVKKTFSSLCRSSRFDPLTSVRRYTHVRCKRDAVVKKEEKKRKRYGIIKRYTDFRTGRVKTKNALLFLSVSSKRRYGIMYAHARRESITERFVFFCFFIFHCFPTDTRSFVFHRRFSTCIIHTFIGT